MLSSIGVIFGWLGKKTYNRFILTVPYSITERTVCVIYASALNGEAEECEKKAAGEGVYLAEEITGDTFVDSYSLFRGAVIFDGEGIMYVQMVVLHTMMVKRADEML